MTVEKATGIVGVTTVEQGSPLGNPILMVSVVLERGCHQVVYYRGMWGQLYEVYRAEDFRVPLNPETMELLCARLEGEMRAALIPAFGAQMDLDLVDP